jgi:RimJ/RimL family protein N-acetyltransferase
MPRLATTLHTQRLRLEPFGERHLDGLNAMNRLPEVMRFLGGQPETQDQTASVITRVQRCWAAWGTSWWAFIETSSGQVAGAGCIQYLRRDAVAPEDLESLVGKPLEIGWRLHPDFWRQGLASEAARGMAAFAFERFPIPELLAVRHPDNVESGRVMDRLGMHQRGLEHPHPTRWAKASAWQRRWRTAVVRMYRLRGNSATVFKLS